MSGFHAEDGYTGPSMFGQDGAIVGGVRNKLTYTASEEDKEQARRTVVVIGLRWLLSPGFRGDDYRDAIFPAEVAQWFEEQIGRSQAVCSASGVGRRRPSPLLPRRCDEAYSASIR